MKRSINSLLTMSFIILSVAFAAGCGKDVKQPPVVVPPPPPPPKYAATFTSEPILNQDTLYARTAGTLTWVSAHATNTALSFGTLAGNNMSATIPALELSTSTTITLTGEDGALVSKVVPIPVYDTVLSFICKGSPKWKMTSAIRYFPGGSVPLSLDPTIWVYHRNYLAYPNGSPNGSPWGHINKGAQYWDRLYLWDNVSINETTWVRQRTDGTNTWVITCTKQ